MCEKKRLKKDLPFGEFNRTVKGTVINYDGIKYFIHKYFSYDDIYVFEENATQILNTIWNDPTWFEDAKINHIDILIDNDKIILRFDNLDIKDVENLAKAIDHYFHSVLEKEDYILGELAGFTTEIKHSY